MRLTNRTVDLVAEGFDAALRVSPARRDDSSLVARKLSLVELHVFASPTYLARAGTPRSAEEAATHDWIAFASGPTTKALAALEHVKPRWIGDDVLFVAKAVVAGVGLGLVPTFLLRDEIASGHVVRILPRIAIPAGALSFVYPPTRHLPRKVSALRDFLVAHFASYPLTASGGKG
jgi:DNA-binding transcriptional LysR family regulator